MKSEEAKVYELHQATDSEKSPVNDENVPATHSETPQDQADMRRLGRKQQLNRNFQSISTLGLTCVIMGTWMGMIASSSFSLLNGGRGGTVWTFIATWIFQVPVIASMAEMASMAPTSAGQYHWVSEFAPPSAQKFLSYVSGWLSALGWQANIAVTSYVTANFILGLSGFYTGYEPTFWQQTLFMMALCLIAILFNAFAARYLPLFEYLILSFDLIGFFAVMIPLWALSPKVSARETFLTFENFGGWPTTGAACIVGILAPAGAFIGADSAAHLSEEVKNASITVPRVMFFTVLLNGAFGLVGIITYVMCIHDVEKQVANATTPFAFMGVFEIATGSKAGAIGMSIPFIVLAYSMTLNSVAAASRQAWSFARDEGLPYSIWLQKVRVVRGTPLPINAMVCTMLIAIVLALINLGGAEAFNSIAGLISGAIGLTYALSIGCVLWRRLFGAPLPNARWSLGRLGVLTNAVGCLFELFITVMSFFPLFAKVTPLTMNWGIAMFGGVAVLSSITYVVKARKVYKGPVVDVKHD